MNTGPAPLGQRARFSSGFSHVEVLLATVLVTMALVPALDALHAGLLGAEIHTSFAADHYEVRGRLEGVLAEPFAALDDAATAAGGPSVPTSYSDLAGPPERLVVFLSRYDGDNADGDDDPFTGVDEDVLWVRVAIEGTVHVLETLTTR